MKEKGGSYGLGEGKKDRNKKGESKEKQRVKWGKRKSNLSKSHWEKGGRGGGNLLMKTLLLSLEIRDQKKKKKKGKKKSRSGPQEATRWKKGDSYNPQVVKTLGGGGWPLVSLNPEVLGGENQKKKKKKQGKRQVGGRWTSVI